MQDLLNLLPALLAGLGALVEAHIPEILAILGGWVALSIRTAAVAYFGAQGGLVADQALELARRRLGEALLRGLAQSNSAAESDRVDAAVAYAFRTIPGTLLSQGWTPADVRDRAVAEVRVHDKGILTLSNAIADGFTAL